MAIPNRVPLLLGLIAAAVWVHGATAAPIDLSRATIPQLQAAMSAGTLTAARLVQFYLARIRTIDARRNGVNAVLAVNPRALADARQLDRERARKGARGPLHGIPILVKDNIDTADPMPTTAGSLALKDNFRQDAPVIARLRAAGAIILGKTNLSEWANFRSSNASSGWSAVGGLTRNPFALDRTACGSSSGSAAAVASGLAPAAIGTETDGSVTCPASMQGLVGLKPSVGLLSRTGVVPISHSQDTPGPIAHTVADAALLMAVMAGHDPADPATQDAPDLHAAFAAVRPLPLRGVRLGVLHYPDGALPMVTGLYAAALDRLRRQGAVLVDLTMPDTTKIGTEENLVLKTELKADMAAYLQGSPPSVAVRTLADLIAFNARTPAETRYFGQDLFEQAEQTKGLDDPAYLAARAASEKASGPDGIDKLLHDAGAVALVAPTTGPAWTIDLIYGDNGSVPAVSTLPAVSGYPHVTVPMGMVSGLPVGISVIGPKWSDATMLSLAASVE
jgi:amidase